MINGHYQAYNLLIRAVEVFLIVITLLKSKSINGIQNIPSRTQTLDFITSTDEESFPETDIIKSYLLL